MPDPYRIGLCGRRQQTQLQKKLEVLAAQIGYVGLAAAGLSLSGMAVPFTYNTFFVQQQPWQWDFLTDYLHMLVQAITILVRACHCGPAGWAKSLNVSFVFCCVSCHSENSPSAGGGRA